MTKSSKTVLRVLWVAPNFNAYKLRFLNHLSQADSIELCVFSGALHVAEGHRESEQQPLMPVDRCHVRKSRFGYSPIAFFKLLCCVKTRQPEVIVMPIEKKLLGMILGLICLRPLYSYKLVSYNHPCLRSKGRVVTPLDMRLTRWLFGVYDRIIFYSENGRNYAVDQRLVSRQKAFFGNNTLDTNEIFRFARPENMASTPVKLAFIGRLTPSRRLDLTLAYFRTLQTSLTDLELHIIGDGPEASQVKQAMEENKNIYWHGAIYEEAEISKYLNDCHAVFHLGSSGLVIVHAFAYGKPFITIRGHQFMHGPEFDYLEDGKNGLILKGADEKEDCQRIVEFLSDQTAYVTMCDVAWRTAQNLSVEHWVERMSIALNVRVNTSEPDAA